MGVAHTWSLNVIMEEEKLCYKQRAEKSAGGEVTLLEWSPTMDVIAIAFSDNSIALNRLSWQRVWNTEPDISSVASLAWRPDGRVLGAGYDGGRIILLNVENGECLHETMLGSVSISFMIWKEIREQKNEEMNDKKEEYPDQSSLVLPGLPYLENIDDDDILDTTKRSLFNPSDDKKLKTLSNALNVLMVGDKNGRVHFCISGILYTTSLPFCEKKSSEVVCMSTSPDFTYLGVVLVGGGEENILKYFEGDISLLAKMRNEFQYITLKYGQIYDTLRYTEDAIQAMADAWEDSLLTVDRKLTKYAQDLPGNLTVADEFIILLGCGKARAELQTFLVEDLTAGGVKKLGLSLEMSYNSIRKLLVNHISRATQNLDFYLHEVLGTANWTDTFAEFSLPKKAVHSSLQVLGSFALKTQELLFLIDKSLRSLKVFFMWLYSIILKLAGDAVPPVIGENFTVEDLAVITEFLQSRFKLDSSKHDQTFSLERVGQYFLNEDLKFIEDHAPSTLEKILENTGLSQDTVPWLIKPCPEKSLRQLFSLLKSNITSLFKNLQDQLYMRFMTTSACELNSHAGVKESLGSCTGVVHKEGMRIAYFPANEEDIVVVFHMNNQPYQFAKIHISNGLHSYHKLAGDESGGDDALSVLFTYDVPGILPTSDGKSSSPWSAVAQLPVSNLLSLPAESAVSLAPEALECLPRTDVGPFLKQVHHLNKFIPKTASFSGTRRLAAVLSSSGKRVRLFDVDFEDDEDEETEDEDI